MPTYRIATLPGDGGGLEVLAKGVKALRTVGSAADADFEFIEFPCGAEHYLPAVEATDPLE